MLFRGPTALLRPSHLPYSFLAMGTPRVLIAKHQYHAMLGAMAALGSIQRMSEVPAKVMVFL